MPRNRPSRRERLFAEVASEFASLDSPLAIDFDHALFMPPWRDRLIDDQLGPWYGPETEAAYERQARMHLESTAGGGLWDPQEEQRMDPEATIREERRQGERYDAEKMSRFVARHSPDIPMRELEVYTDFYITGLTKGQTARHLEISKKTVENTLLNLRRRMKAARAPRGE